MSATPTVARPARYAGRTLPTLAGLAAVVGLALVTALPASAACQTPVTRDYLESVKQNPRVVLQNSPQGGDQLIYRVQMLATATIGSLRDLMRAVPFANQAQKSAIGEGLGRATGACISRYGEISRRVSDAVRQLGDRDVTRAYAAFLTPDGSDAATRSQLPDYNIQRSDGSHGLPSDLSPRGLTLSDPFKAP